MKVAEYLRTDGGEEPNYKGLLELGEHDVPGGSDGGKGGVRERARPRKTVRFLVDAHPHGLQQQVQPRGPGRGQGLGALHRAQRGGPALAGTSFRHGLVARGHPAPAHRAERPAGRVQERGLLDVRGADERTSSSRFCTTCSAARRTCKRSRNSSPACRRRCCTKRSARSAAAPCRTGRTPTVSAPAGRSAPARSLPAVAPSAEPASAPMPEEPPQLEIPRPAVGSCRGRSQRRVPVRERQEIQELLRQGGVLTSGQRFI